MAKGDEDILAPRPPHVRLLTYSSIKPIIDGVVGNDPLNNTYILPLAENGTINKTFEIQFDNKTPKVCPYLELDTCVQFPPELIFQCTLTGNLTLENPEDERQATFLIVDGDDYLHPCGMNNGIELKCLDPAPLCSGKGYQDTKGMAVGFSPSVRVSSGPPAPEGTSSLQIAVEGW